jgi:hypothetical protein
MSVTVSDFLWISGTGSLRHGLAALALGLGLAGARLSRLDLDLASSSEPSSGLR